MENKMNSTVQSYLTQVERTLAAWDDFKKTMGYDKILKAEQARNETTAEGK